MEGLLFGVSAVDVVTYATVAASVTAVALLASYLPGAKGGGRRPDGGLWAEYRVENGFPAATTERTL